MTNTEKTSVLAGTRIGKINTYMVHCNSIWNTGMREVEGLVLTQCLTGELSSCRRSRSISTSAGNVGLSLGSPCQQASMIPYLQQGETKTHRHSSMFHMSFYLMCKCWIYLMLRASYTFKHTFQGRQCQEPSSWCPPSVVYRSPHQSERQDKGKHLLKKRTQSS